VPETVNFDHITRHYYTSHDTITPHGIIPINPRPDFNAPHGRG
jgi:putative glutathione S-transferase